MDRNEHDNQRKKRNKIRPRPHNKRLAGHSLAWQINSAYKA
jgi:hypothetical protein